MSASPSESPSLWRRIAAACYDLLAVAAVGLASAFLLTAVGPGPQGAGLILWRGTLVAVPAAYFLVSWVRGGQTLGMRAWGLRVVDGKGRSLSWRLAALRLAAALPACSLLGLGLLWAGLDREGLAWHDRLSGTRLVRRYRVDQRRR